VGFLSDDVEERLEELIGDVARSFAAAGHRFYLVGGIVRDLALGYDVISGGSLDTDIDVTTDATPDVIRELVRPWARTIWDQGARFGTIGARCGDVALEITTHRAERYQPDSRKPEVDFSTQVTDDLSRRDFTVNAMALEVPTWELVDPFGGEADLEAGVLRTPIDPRASFTDDPLRMLRAARFAAGYRLTPVDDLVAAMVELADRLRIVSRERIGEEMRKFLSIDAPSRGVELLQRTGVLALVVGDGLSVEDIQPALIEAAPADPTLRWAALLATAGVGPADAPRALERLRGSAKFERDVVGILRAARLLDDLDGADVVAARRVVLAAAEHLTAGAELLAALGRPVRHSEWTVVSTVVEQEGRESLRSPLDGDQVMAATDARGRAVGDALAFLLETRLERGPLTTAEAQRVLRAWWAERETPAPDRPDSRR